MELAYENIKVHKCIKYKTFCITNLTILGITALQPLSKLFELLKLKESLIKVDQIQLSGGASYGGI